MIYIKPFYPSYSTTSPPLNNPQTISSISTANHSPLSSENHRSLFVKPAKRGKQRAGGEALFAPNHFPFYYQPRHPHNCFISQLRWYCIIIPMDVFYNINSLMMQRRRCRTNISMDASIIMNVLTTQLGTSYSFDSPGLARNKPTPGKHSQGDSTP